MRVSIERTEEDDRAFDELCGLLATVDDPAFMRDFINELLTESEITEIARRWRLVKLLKQGLTQRDIAARLHLSLCKITRGAKMLKQDRSAFGRMIELRSGPDQEAETT